jgi:hypothetical protein
MCSEAVLPDSSHEQVEGDLEQTQRSDRDPDVLDDLARALFNPSQVNPVKLVYETDSRFHADMPARYKLMFPVALPHKLNPHIPGPPYYREDSVYFHQNLHLSVLRPFLMGALHELLGAEAPVASMLGTEYEPLPENGMPTAGSLVWMHFDGVWVDDKETGMNLETGYWRGGGREGYGIDAYFEYEDSDDVFIVQWIVYHIDWRVGEVEAGKYPPIVTLKAQAELEDLKVVFHVSEHPEWSWRYTHLRGFEPFNIDDDLRRHLERMDELESARRRLELMGERPG